MDGNLSTFEWIILVMVLISISIVLIDSYIWAKKNNQPSLIELIKDNIKKAIEILKDNSNI